MEHKAQILFVDDEQLLHGLFERLFTRHGIKVTSCSDANHAITELKKNRYDLVVTDFMMPDMDGFELLSYIRTEHPHTKVIMITAHSNVQHAVRSMKNGAIDYIPKPFSTTELVERVQNCLAVNETEELQAATTKPRRGRLRDKSRSVEYVGEHLTIRKLKQLLPRVSNSNAPVFIQGESGTGKEILAKLIHQMSDRASGPYVTINCANLPRELVESHLFGHRKGAFTGAIDDMTGAFEVANQGTLLLDEITEIDLSVQAKLLRVLQESEFQKIGSSEVKRVNVRVVATSNRILGEAIHEGIFRADLFYRLSVFPLTVPPLRERLSDVPLLVSHFMQKYTKMYDLPAKTIDDELMERLIGFNWPGNVRQLENVIQRGVILSADRTTVVIEDVFNDFFNDAEPRKSEDGHVKGVEPQTIDDMERIMIMKALEETNNNQQRAAERLGISARTIRNKLRRYREGGTIAI